MVGKGKSVKDHIVQGGSGISPQQKRLVKTPRKRKATLQTSISEWLSDDDVGKQATQAKDMKTPPPHPLPTQSDLGNMLSPIPSQPCGRAETSVPSVEPPPFRISNALNLAASASSLRKDFATCEKNMSEKHQILDTMLDGMDRKVSDIGDKLMALESCVGTLEKNQNLHLTNAQSIFQAYNARQNELENKIRDSVPVINTNKKKCELLDQLSMRISQVDNQLKSNGVNKNKDAENVSVAIYGLRNCDDVIQTVNQLFYDINLSHVKCVSAIRTPHRPESDRLGVVIADLRSLKEKQNLLYRKRYLRSHPVHSNVFIKSAKTHTEQVMDANFSVVLNEMNNGKAYYVCDNGRIRPKPRENGDIRSNIAYGGARQKTFTHNRDYGNITKDNSHLRYNDLDNVRYNRQDYRYNSG